MVYSSKRIFLIILFIIAMAATIFWDRGWDDFGGIFALLSQSAKSAGFSWMASFLERLASDSMTLGMVITLVVVIFYGLVQYVGAWGDSRVVSDHGKSGQISGWKLWPRRGVMWLSGRPTPNNGSGHHGARQSQEIHFGYGRHTLLAPLRLALWAFPVVGFLGTVIGISGAVARLPQVLEDTQQLNLLLSSLHTAFDTTFVGLAASLVIMGLLHVIESRWDQNEMAYFAFADGSK